MDLGRLVGTFARMRIAVAGGTGLVGGMTVRALERAGHDPVVISRSTGANTITGDGLDEALQGVEAVVDASNTNELEADATRAFFGTSTKNLLAAEERAGVGHHVVLSIIGIDRVSGNGHYAGKLRQEEVAEAGPVPVTILRAAQFFEFAELVMGWMRDGDTITLPPLLLQPVAAAATSPTRWPRSRRPRRSDVPRISPGPSRRTSSTWRAASSPPAATAPPASCRAGRTGRSASRWRARSCCPGPDHGSPRRRSRRG